MSTYLVINLLIVIVPLLFSFEKKIRFHTKITSYLFSVAIVSPVFIIWDMIATSRGDWAFNPEHISSLIIYNLPIDEILFFFTVPYSCLFIYETVSFYILQKELSINPVILKVVALVLVLSALIFIDRYYTATVLLFTAAFLVISVFFFSQIIKLKLYWITIAITFIPFLIFNFVLTYIPVVIYSDEAIWGIKLITIPVEDFFYSYSMISFWILIYLLRENKIKLRLLFSKR